MATESVKAIVNGQYEFPDLNTSDLDIIAEGENHFHILKNNQAFRAEVIDTDMANKTITVKVNGSSYEVKLEDQYDQLVKRLGLGKQTQQKVKDIKAPMPGLVIQIVAEPGQAIQKGDTLLILEAMKMENVIKSPGEGVVKQINAKKGQAVEKGYVLIEME